MSEKQSDSLIKPDMSAVLSRTHVSNNTHGFLLPVFEAISNAMHGVEARFGSSAHVNGIINVRFVNTQNPGLIQVSVIDNGIGLNDPNYKSFKTPFSGYKLKQKGRGFGRFIAFKVFSRVTYSTRYEFFNTIGRRDFRFDIRQDDEISFIQSDSELVDSGVHVSYEQPLTNWHDLIRSLNEEEILTEIGSHFLPYFLYKWLPLINVQFDDGEPEDISKRFKAVFVQYADGEFTCEIDGVEERLYYSLARINRSKNFRNHCLLLSAADRIVGTPRDLSQKIGEPFFTDENENKYVVIAVVRGEVFESRLNDARTGINLSSRTVEDIVKKISDIIQSKEHQQIAKIKFNQSHSLDSALKENPILRLGLKGKSIAEYVASKPNNWSEEEFVSDLAVERFRATNDLIKQIVAASANSENYESTIKVIVDKIDRSKKEALAEYVIHRKNIISLVESARKFQKDGKHSPEDTIHDLVFKRFSDNVSVDYFEHNLWLIDDALAFLPYVSSDRTIHGGRRKTGDKITDLLFFDESLVLGDSDGTTLTIVEFKKPSRNNFIFGREKDDPVFQVIKTLNQVTKVGGISKSDGTHFSFAGVVKKFAYIIADLTPSLVEVLKMHDFKNDWNPRIFVRFRDHEQIFIQAFGYDTLVENAKKRNQAFFSVLFDE
ncbi:ATP-binding protein [Methylobacterium sp. Leaf117]|uniref:ATP-binding protein n=1 Tax=Methylobacterium sp. Leaf117 TaxID=1736260 RepID=UPI000A7631DC|nr:ATP-binding protein [Methylobacterium sp. Leaf117]